MSQVVCDVREAQSTDLEALVELAAQLGYAADKDKIESRLQSIMSDQNSVLLVAADDTNHAIGFVHIGVRPLIVADRTAEVCGLVVHSGVRAKGFGKTLLQAAEQWAVKKQCREVTLRSNVLREEAHEFYKRLGYTIYKTQFAFKKNIGPAKS